MPRRLHTNGEPETTSDCTPAPIEPSASEDQLRRWAELVVEGQALLPEDLFPADEERLVALVRIQLRGRLVRLIARALATHISRRAEPVTEDAGHV